MLSEAFGDLQVIDDEVEEKKSQTKCDIDSSEYIPSDHSPQWFTKPQQETDRREKCRMVADMLYDRSDYVGSLKQIELLFDCDDAEGLKNSQKFALADHALRCILKMDACSSVFSKESQQSYLMRYYRIVSSSVSNYAEQLQFLDLSLEVLAKLADEEWSTHDQYLRNAILLCFCTDTPENFMKLGNAKIETQSLDFRLGCLCCALCQARQLSRPCYGDVGRRYELLSQRLEETLSSSYLPPQVDAMVDKVKQSYREYASYSSSGSASEEEKTVQMSEEEMSLNICRFLDRFSFLFGGSEKAKKVATQVDVKRMKI